MIEIAPVGKLLPARTTLLDLPLERGEVVGGELVSAEHSIAKAGDRAGLLDGEQLQLVDPARERVGGNVLPDTGGHGELAAASTCEFEDRFGRFSLWPLLEEIPREHRVESEALAHAAPSLGRPELLWFAADSILTAERRHRRTGLEIPRPSRCKGSMPPRCAPVARQ
jgi:hypothetical protein